MRDDEPTKEEAAEEEAEIPCGRCLHHFPQDRPIILPLAPPRPASKLALPGVHAKQQQQAEGLMACICRNLKSRHCGQIMFAGGTCDKAEPVPPQPDPAAKGPAPEVLTSPEGASDHGEN